MITPEEFAGLVFILSISAIFYSIGRLSVSYKNNREIKLMTDKVNYTLEKYSDKNTKKKELSSLQYESQCVKNHIDSLVNDILNKRYNIDLINIQIEQEEERIRIAKAKLMIINTEITQRK